MRRKTAHSLMFAVKDILFGRYRGLEKLWVAGERGKIGRIYLAGVTKDTWVTSMIPACFHIILIINV